MSASAFQRLKELFAPTDEQLMWRVQMQDDHGAFAELMRRWETPIRRLCERMTGDEFHAQDLTQEVFTRLFAYRRNFNQGSKFSTYLWRIALNHTYNELRRPRHRHELLFEAAGPDGEPLMEPGSEAPAPDEQLARQETAEAIRNAVLELPEQFRSLLILRHYENLKFREIAEVLGIPEGTAKTRMTEALNELARRLRRRLDLKIGPSPNRRTRPSEISVL